MWLVSKQKNPGKGGNKSRMRSKRKGSGVNGNCVLESAGETLNEKSSQNGINIRFDSERKTLTGLVRRLDQPNSELIFSCPQRKKDVSSSLDFTGLPCSGRPSPRIAFSLGVCVTCSFWGGSMENWEWIRRSKHDHAEWMELSENGVGFEKKGDFFSKGWRRNLNSRTEIIKKDV